MKKFLATSAVLLSIACATPAFAETISTTASGSTTVTSHADLACMSTAVDARESAVISARTTFNANMLTALNTRRSALQAAYTIANNHDRQVAMKAAWNAYLLSSKTAHTQYQTSTQATWKTFVTSIKLCNVLPNQNHTNSGAHLGNTETIKLRQESRQEARMNNGLHLGLIKKMQEKHNESDVEAKTGARIDLSF